MSAGAFPNAAQRARGLVARLSADAPAAIKGDGADSAGLHKFMRSQRCAAFVLLGDRRAGGRINLEISVESDGAEATLAELRAAVDIIWPEARR